MTLTQAQQVMVDDGFPESLFRTADQRRKWWDDHPPRSIAMGGAFDDANDPKAIERRQMMEKYKLEQNRKRDNHLANLVAKKKRQQFDTTGKRWDAKRSKWVEEDNHMPKWKITPYDVDGNAIQKGVTSIPEGVEQVALLGKMGAVFHRLANDTINKIAVTDSADILIREWTAEDGVELPKPEPKPPKLDKVIKKAKAKGERRVAKGKAKKATKPASRAPAVKRPPKNGPGVIETVVSVIKRAKGATIEEIMVELVKVFPDRDPKGMTATARIQANKHSTTKEKDAKRGGLVYYREGE